MARSLRYVRDATSELAGASAAKRRQSIARGVSPGSRAVPVGEPRRGGRPPVAPSGLGDYSHLPLQGLTPLAIDCRPFGTQALRAFHSVIWWLSTLTATADYSHSPMATTCHFGSFYTGTGGVTVGATHCATLGRTFSRRPRWRRSEPPNSHDRHIRLTPSRSTPSVNRHMFTSPHALGSP
jgi:hypothetical protein